MGFLVELIIDGLITGSGEALENENNSKGKKTVAAIFLLLVFAVILAFFVFVIIMVAKKYLIISIALAVFLIAIFTLIIRSFVKAYREKK